MFKKLTEDYAVIGRQLEISDIPDIIKAGYKTIICNRPNNEEENQTSFQSIEKEAREHGIETFFLPVKSGDFTASKVKEFSQAVSKLPAPILGYCRTGTRSTILWALSEKSSGKSIDSILQASKSAGYNIEGFVVS